MKHRYILAFKTPEMDVKLFYKSTEFDKMQERLKEEIANGVQAFAVKAIKDK